MRVDGLPDPATGHSAELVGDLARCFGNAQLRGEVVKLFDPEIVPVTSEAFVHDFGIGQLVDLWHHVVPLVVESCLR